jgi:hypothetical protein
MLTIAKLTTYAKFNGDIDGWARAADRDDAAGPTDAEWYLIDELLMNLVRSRAAGLPQPLRPTSSSACRRAQPTNRLAMRCAHWRRSGARQR